MSRTFQRVLLILQRNSELRHCGRWDDHCPIALAAASKESIRALFSASLLEDLGSEARVASVYFCRTRPGHGPPCVTQRHRAPYVSVWVISLYTISSLASLIRSAAIPSFLRQSSVQVVCDINSNVQWLKRWQGGENTGFGDKDAFARFIVYAAPCLHIGHVRCSRSHESRQRWRVC